MKYLVFLYSFLYGFHLMVHIEFLGLDNQKLTSLDINYGILAVGTDRNGVYWQYGSEVTKDGWNKIRMDSSVQSVYPHKSGPIGWAITAGIAPVNFEPPFVFCSYLGGDFEENSDGILSSTTTSITALDGFPDPTICGETYAAAGRALYRRFYSDTLWQPVFTATVEGALQTVKVRQEYPGVVLVGGADGFAGILLARSTDFGVTWDDISPFGMISGIDFSGTSADTIFAAASDKIFRTTDGGVNWTTVYAPGNGSQLTEILYDAEHHTIYAAGGAIPEDAALLLVSHDFGEHWEPISLSGLGTIRGLEIGSDGWVYFITRDDGVFRLRDGASAVNETDRNTSGRISLLQNSPNPVAALTRIDFEIPEASDVILNVLDIAGHEIAMLLNERKAVGTHSISWDASSLAGGVYLLSLRASGQLVTRKMVVLR